ncbi:hypothetical protein EVJ58_g829 [Rhodofomes roseus]|uniref:NADH:flavin oxidoreductase/NADH oxidase N-terminal domain-containing protein n=1 Tax=Rhodofomes roseus TaxID=34475 RepID=A0A4Y9Z400_9APHY|nr:hypothetical protein EVJ58_g829 [Rhodofomes roseus]
MPQDIFNSPAPKVDFFTPSQYPPSGTAVDDGKPIPTLFQPIKIRGVVFPNRIWLSPLCQYSAQDGKYTFWHYAHMGGIISRGPGLSMVEATAVTPEGAHHPRGHRTRRSASSSAMPAARRPPSPPWLSKAATATEAANGWPDDVWAPSAIGFAEVFPRPKELTIAGIKRIKRAFVDAARRALRAGFDVIEIHNAHGYLLHSFLSPVSNKRTDEYGGSFENRTRLTLEIVDAVRSVIPPDMPLFLRISATDWLEESLEGEPSWTLQDTVRLAGLLAEHGVDLLDVSSGGAHPAQKIPGAPTYQAPLAEAVKKAHGDKILVSAVGLITDGKTAQGVLDKGQADAVFVGRQFQKNPGTVWQFAEELGVDIKRAHQIEWGFTGRANVDRKHRDPSK